MTFAKLRLVTVGIVAALGLSACGSLNEQSPAAGISQMVKARLAARTGTPPPAAPVLTREAADANPGAFMLLSRAGSGTQASLVTAGVNGTKVTWMSADQVSVTLENGIIVATRGFVQDMMAADISQVVNALVTSGGTAQRRVEYLDGLDQISTELLQCRIASGGFENVEALGKMVETERFDEVCSSDIIQYTNIYWINDDGVITKSRQLVSPGVGYVDLIRP
tara:strand:- start:384 stop:1052 length:669 start_codon:yes stop_codon:yes gene_type:complete